MEQINSRIHGLDILRSAAILLVLMCHYTVFISHQPTFGVLSEIGWVGVDLFFLLSGYLIGNQIFSMLVKQHKFSLKLFYSRRLIRTLPNYLVVLGLYFLIPGFREVETLSPLWKYLTFTQNFGLQIGTAFSHAWSLCIEEQFYLILPLLALRIVHNKATRTLGFILITLLIGGIILRAYLWNYCTQHEFKILYFKYIYYTSYCRLDELIFGVAIAFLKNFHIKTWEKIMTKSNWFFLCGIIGSCLTCYWFMTYHYSFFMTVFGFPLLAISFAALTISALSPNSYLSCIKIPGAATFAVWSYAIYLIHKPVSVLIYHKLTQFGVESSSLLAITIIMVCSILSGKLLYDIVEKPFLKMRNKLKFDTDIISDKRIATE